MWFVKNNNYFSNKDYTDGFRVFIRKEKYRSVVTTSDRVQPFCKNFDSNIDCFDKEKKTLETLLNKLYIIVPFYIHFSLIGKTNSTSFNQAKEQLKSNVKVVVIVRSDKQVKSFAIYEYKLEKVQYSLTKIFVYDIETFIKDRAVPVCCWIYILKKVFGKNNPDITETEYQKVSNDCFVFTGTNCFNEKLDHVLEIKGEPRKVNIKIV